MELYFKLTCITHIKINTHTKHVFIQTMLSVGHIGLCLWIAVVSFLSLLILKLLQ